MKATATTEDISGAVTLLGVLLVSQAAQMGVGCVVRRCDVGERGRRAANRGEIVGASVHVSSMHEIGKGVVRKIYRRDSA
eukprot:IDg5327t1